MPHDTYLLIGGGMTADAATQGIRAVDPDGTIGLIGMEPVPPYNRPPLSKGLSALLSFLTNCSNVPDNECYLVR